MVQPQLSLCMIVRNEEAMLPELLASVDGLWDEFVAVDTGSTDGTVALLKAAGATVVSHRWRNDFAAARNASLAAATGRWILFLDADERVSPQLRRDIRELLADEQAGAATVVMRNELPGGLHRESHLLRLFRGDAGIRFRYRIHEDVTDAVAEMLERTGRRLRRLGGVVLHLGYVREVAADRAKKDRDLGLLRLALTDDPNDFYCRFKILEIARFWGDRDLWRDSAAETAPLLDALGEETAGRLRRRPWSGELAALVSQGLHAEPGAALAWLDRSGCWAAPTPALRLRRGVLLEELGRHTEARVEYETCLTMDDSGLRQHTTVRPLLGLCRLAAAVGDPAGALALARRAVTVEPRDPEALLAAVGFSLLTGGEAELANFTDAHLDEHPDAVCDLGRVLLQEGRIELTAAALRRRAGSDAEAALGLLVCAQVLGKDVDLQLDVDQEVADRLLRLWVRLLWNGRRTEHMAAFTDHLPAVTGIFPWLPEFLDRETWRLRGS